MTLCVRMYVTAVGHLSHWSKGHIPIPHSHTIQSFIIEDVLLSSGYFSLERPIVARRLRFVINNAVTDGNGRLCWQLEMFGCLLSRGRQIDSKQNNYCCRVGLWVCVPASYWIIIISAWTNNWYPMLVATGSVCRYATSARHGYQIPFTHFAFTLRITLRVYKPCMRQSGTNVYNSYKLSWQSIACLLSSTHYIAPGCHVDAYSEQ